MYACLLGSNCKLHTCQPLPPVPTSLSPPSKWLLGDRSGNSESAFSQAFCGRVLQLWQRAREQTLLFERTFTPVRHQSPPGSHTGRLQSVCSFRLTASVRERSPSKLRNQQSVAEKSGCFTNVPARIYGIHGQVKEAGVGITQRPRRMALMLTVSGSRSVANMTAEAATRYCTREDQHTKLLLRNGMSLCAQWLVLSALYVAVTQAAKADQRPPATLVILKVRKKEVIVGIKQR